MKKQYQAVTAAEAVKVIKSGDHVHISSVSNVPQCLVKALCDRGRAGELKNVYIHHLHTEGVISLSVSNGAVFEYRVHNLLGQQVLSGQSHGELLLDLSSCQKGLYFVSITQEGNTHIEKIVIK
jgi:hypothetical protein